MQDKLNFIAEAKLSYPDLSGISEGAKHASAKLSASSSTSASTSASTSSLISSAKHFSKSNLTDSSTEASKSGSQGKSHICAGSLVALAAGICDDHQNDVLDSTLFAQFAANAQYQRETQTAQWYSAYQTMLNVLGWNVSGFSFEQCMKLPHTFKLSSELMGIAFKKLSKSGQQSLQASLQSLSAFSSASKQIQTLGRSAVTATAGNFQLGVVQESKDELVSMQMTAVWFTSQGIPDNFLFQNYSSSMNLYASTQTMVLDDGVYSHMKELVKSRLNEQIEQFIVSIPLG